MLAVLEHLSAPEPAIWNVFRILMRRSCLIEAPTRQAADAYSIAQKSRIAGMGTDLFHRGGRTENGISLVRFEGF
jgi:hypothetical protein